MHDLMIGQNCLDKLRKNPAQLLKERKLPAVEPTKPSRGGGRNRSERELAAAAGEYRAVA